MTEHEEFIAAFKRVEQQIRNSKDAPPEANFKWLEDRVTDQSLQTKMRMCRNIRNYIQHEPDYGSFIQISPAMIKLLDSIYKKLLSASDKVYGQVNCTESRDLLQSKHSLQAAARDLTASHRERIAVIDEQQRFIGMITTTIITKYFALGETNASLDKIQLDLSDVMIVSKEDVVKASSDTIVITENGGMAGKVVGVIY